jgi:hypothetical protein
MSIPTRNEGAAATVSTNGTATLLLVLIAAAITLLHLLTNNRYGFHRDELQFLSDARHLDWGFVAYPPFTAFVEHIGLSLFGLSLVGLRLFSVLAQALVIFVAGLMARELGGGRFAQVTAALAVALSPLPLFEGTEFQYSTFDYLWWTLAAYFIIRLLKTDNPRWWLAIGVALGLGLETKYTALFLIAGILGAMVLTPARRYFLNCWFWAGVAIALVLFLPNFLWQVRHSFISYQFLQHIHARDVRQGRGSGFFKDQFLICVNLAAAPLWIAGLIAALRSSRYRMLAWIYLIPLSLFAIQHARGYYLAAAYPMLLAFGATAAESWLANLPTVFRRLIEVIYFTAFAVVAVYVCTVVVPLAASGPLRDFALSRNGDLREEFGWHELVQTVASVRDSLTPEQQAHLGIVVGNYGENGAIELFGPDYHLPFPISGTNSAWLRSYPTSQPTTLIVIGDGDRDSQFTNCKLARTISYPANQDNEESRDHPDIYVCGPPRLPWLDLWKVALSFG